MDKKHIELALLNIDKFGDTDIFPFPIEKQIFFDRKEEVVSHIQKIHADFNLFLDKLPPVNINTFSPVGYTGFRWATQIDPVWNVYFLSLVISIADKIEIERLGTNKKIVHSYRYSPDYKTGTLFNNDINWQSFQRQSLDVLNTDNFQHVVICDIADYYSRIYHHKLENALLRLGIEDDTPKRIIGILQKFSGTNSHSQAFNWFMESGWCICALVVHRRVFIPSGQTLDEDIPVDDPSW